MEFQKLRRISILVSAITAGALVTAHTHSAPPPHAAPPGLGPTDVNVTNAVLDVNITSAVDINPAAQNLVEHRIVGLTGFTTGKIEDADGIGFYAMHRACADQVAANARACFTNEVQRPPTSILPVFQFAWVIPSSYIVEKIGGEWRVTDFASGRIVENAVLPSAKGLMNCNSHTVDGSANNNFTETGTIMFPSGGMGARACSLTARIACCAPVASPVTE